MPAHILALLTTGDEIVNGDILNTNATNIASRCFDQGITMGNHLTCTDEQADLVRAMRFLLEHHDGLIITGGLGPTSDDRTRFALAEVMGCDLLEDEESWAMIKRRHESIGLSTTSNNRQQAQFPQHAQVLKNHRGTANGCYVEFEGKPIFMLPGPPHENLPIFETDVLPKLGSLWTEHHTPLLIWRLFGVPESVIASQVDQALINFGCDTGFRWHFPYIDVKVRVTAINQIEEIKAVVAEIVEPHIICQPNETACENLSRYLENPSKVISIYDEATGGLLQSKILTPANYQQIRFNAEKHADCHFEITGLSDYWQNDPDAKQFTVSLKSILNEKMTVDEINIPFRFSKMPLYLAELVAQHILIKMA